MSGPVPAQHQPAPDVEPMPKPQVDNASSPSGLPPQLWQSLQTLEESDAKLLAVILQNTPQYRDAILAEVARELGNAIVTEALALLDAEQQGGGPSTPGIQPPGETAPGQGIAPDPNALDTVLNLVRAMD